MINLRGLQSHSTRRLQVSSGIERLLYLLQQRERVYMDLFRIARFLIFRQLSVTLSYPSLKRSRKIEAHVVPWSLCPPKTGFGNNFHSNRRVNPIKGAGFSRGRSIETYPYNSKISQGHPWNKIKNTSHAVGGQWLSAIMPTLIRSLYWNPEATLSSREVVVYYLRSHLGYLNQIGAFYINSQKQYWRGIRWGVRRIAFTALRRFQRSR